MYKIAKPMFLIAETPIHAGSGSDLGYIDNPIQREKHTGYPKIEGSSLKGALRQDFESKSSADDYRISLNKVFGFDKDGISEKVKNHFSDKKDFAGAIGFTDARILLFPVKSLKGTFAWVTCPRVLAKFKKEITEICGNNFDFAIPEKGVASNETLFIDESKTKIQLDEYIYKDLREEDNTKNIAQWLKTNAFANNGIEVADIKRNLVIIDNDDFADFVRFGTEVSTRIKIDNETGTVESGALFTVEYLPAETVMYSLAMFSPEFSAEKEKMKDLQVEKFFIDNKSDYFQLGGDATLGKGIFNLIYKEVKDGK